MIKLYFRADFRTKSQAPRNKNGSSSAEHHLNRQLIEVRHNYNKSIKKYIIKAKERKCQIQLICIATI